MNEDVSTDKFTLELPSDLVDEKVVKFFQIMVDLITIYAKKNHDYGNSFDEGCNKIGPAYATGRLLDKLNRVINLTKHPDSAKVDESIEDTLLDLSNYSIMYVMYRRTKKII